jgi:iron-sulfur cluster repair protein YtfE (RIC family)
MTTVNNAMERNLITLSQYVPIVARVHGGSHPEFLEVRRVFNQLHDKIRAAEDQQPELNHEFQELRQITNNYTVPTDVCESYEAVYKMLSELDRAYQG